MAHQYRLGADLPQTRRSAAQPGRTRRIRQARARDEGVDLLIFPELSMTGYQVQDLVPEVALRTDTDDSVFAELLNASRDLDMVVGFAREDSRNRFYIANAYLSGGETLHIHHKLYLPHLRHVRRIALLRAGQQRSRLRYALRPRRHADLRGLLACLAALSALAGWGGYVHPQQLQSLARTQRQRPAGRHPLGRAGEPGLWQHVHLVHPALQSRRL